MFEFLKILLGRRRLSARDRALRDAILAMGPHYTPPVVVLGWSSHVEINSFDFGVKSGTINDSADSLECGDTETGIFKAEKLGRRQCEVSLEFYEKSIDLAGANIPSAAGPPLLDYVAGEEIFLAIAPDFYAPGANQDSWTFPSFMVSKFTVRLNIEGKVEGSLSGKSNGDYTRPGE
jgi:hypothetical protein